MGMHTIRVETPEIAIAELENILGIRLT